VEREIKRLPGPDRDRVIEAIRSLAETPRPYGIKQLERGIYRMRVGNYRVIYQVLDDEHLILVGRVARRSERTYRDWQQLFEEPEEYETVPFQSPSGPTTSR
jgi:mRNA interferase RelE/StbE